MDFQLNQTILDLYITKRSLSDKLKKIFLERILDDDNLSLIKNNMVIRERISYLNENEPVKLALIEIDDNKITKSKSEILQKIGPDFINKYSKVIASYVVYRYQINEIFTVDQTIWNFEDLKQRQETLSIKLQTEEEIKMFQHKYNLQLSNSKWVTYICHYNPKMFCDFCKSKGIQYYSEAPLILNDPDLTLLN